MSIMTEGLQNFFPPDKSDLYPETGMLPKPKWDTPGPDWWRWEQDLYGLSVARYANHPELLAHFKRLQKKPESKACRIVFCRNPECERERNLEAKKFKEGVFYTGKHKTCGPIDLDKIAEVPVKPEIPTVTIRR